MHFASAAAHGSNYPAYLGVLAEDVVDLLHGGARALGGALAAATVMMVTLRRSLLVIESRMVSTRLNCFSSTEPAACWMPAKGPTETSGIAIGLGITTEVIKAGITRACPLCCIRIDLIKVAKNALY